MIKGASSVRGRGCRPGDACAVRLRRRDRPLDGRAWPGCDGAGRRGGAERPRPPATGLSRNVDRSRPARPVLADALVNGLPVRMMIDTGASFVTISASTAARLGLVPGSGPKWTVKTANGKTVASPVTLDT